MSFSPGQLIFAGIFIVIFILVMRLAYRTDKGYIRFHYKGTYKILLFIIATFALLWVLVRFI